MLEINSYRTNPEKIFIARNELREKALTENEEFVHNRLTKEVLEISPSMDDFSDVYNEDQIKKDKLELSRVLENFGAKTKRAELAESILGTQIEEADWFGPECDVTYCSKFDDTLNHTDMILAFPGNKEKPIFLGIDVTTTDKKNEIEGKESRIFREIEREGMNKLGRIKYYDSVEYPEFKGTIFFVPRVIIKFSKQEVERLSSLMRDVLLRKEGSNKKLSEDEIQLKILEETKAQLEVEFYHSVYIFLDEVEKRINNNPSFLEKEEARGIYEIWQAWSGKKFEELARSIENNEDIVRNFEKSIFKAIENIKDALKTVSAIAKEKRSDLNINKGFDNTETLAPFEAIREEREKDIIFSSYPLFH